MINPLSKKIQLVEGERNEYLANARKDIATRRAMHNAQLQSYDQEIKPMKRKIFFSNVKQGFMNLGHNLSKMGPQ